MRKSVWLLSAGLAAISCPAIAQDNQSTPQPTEPSPTEQAGTTDEAQAAAEAATPTLRVVRPAGA